MAHIYLSGSNRKVQIGNFVGDAVKGTAYLRYSADFQKGILLHREIDAFSDHHPLVREAVALGRQPFGRYSAVVTDILFDHFLAVNFREFSTVSLGRFARMFYLALMMNYRYLPERFQGFLWHFILTNRLKRYASADGIRQSLEIMAAYRGLQVDPEEAIRFMEINYEKLQSLFRGFFPDVQLMCAERLPTLKVE